MILNKKVVESMTVLVLALVLTITAVTNGGATVADIATAENVLANTGLERDGIAGIAATINEYELLAASELENRVSITETEEVVVTATEEVELTEEEQEWQSYLMANIDDYLNVRAEANADSAVVGKLYKGDRATIVAVGEEWTQITSGNVNGFVNNGYCVMGTDALNYAKANCETVAKATTGGLRVRTEASTEGGVATVLGEGDTVVVDTAASAVDGWVAVSYKSSTCYVSAEYVEVYMKVGSAITIEEEQAALAAKRQAEAEAAAAKNQTSSTGTTQGSSLAASVDDVTLLAALIQCEAGGQCYDGQLAVGAVVVNRVKSGYAGSLYGVIYQRGQFGPAGSGKLERRLANGVSSTAYSAAQAALSGQDNTGGATSFKNASSGHAGVVIGDHVFY